MFNKLVAERKARIRNLQTHYAHLDSKAEAAKPKPKMSANQDRQLSQLDDQERSLERDIAHLEGRPYRDEDYPDGEPPHPPEDVHEED